VSVFFAPVAAFPPAGAFPAVVFVVFVSFLSLVSCASFNLGFFDDVAKGVFGLAVGSIFFFCTFSCFPSSVFLSFFFSLSFFSLSCFSFSVFSSA
jgi:hypothetical protein